MNMMTSDFLPTTVLTEITATKAKIGAEWRSVRTTAERREVLDKWRADHEHIADPSIFVNPARPSDNPRHSALAGELRSLLVWRYYAESSVPLATNWMLSEKDEDRSVNSEHEIRP